MKKLIMFMLVLLVFSGLAAAQLKYWTSEVYLQGIPREYDDGALLTKVATVFTPVDDCTLEGVYFPFYGPGAAGQGNVFIAIYPVDTEGLPNMGGLPMASATVRYEDLVNWATAPIGEDYNYVDFSATGLSFGPTGTHGSAFAMVMSCPNGLLPNIKTATMHDETVTGNSYNYLTVVEPVGWDLWYDYCFTAEVTYAGDLIDVAASSITFSGDFFLAPGEVINYEAEVMNNSMDNTGGPIPVTDVDVTIALRDLTDDTILWSDLQTVNLAAEETMHINTFADCTLPAVGGRYYLQLQVWHDSDITLTNNNLYLQQDVPDLTLEDELAYDNGSGSMAHAFYDAGTGWANAFWYNAQPLKITEVSFEMRDDTWPVGALGNLSYAIYPDDGTGYPDMANPLEPITQTACTLGEWNTFDVSAYNINIPAGETFYVSYFQVGDYEAGAPGLMGDQSQPISSWATSYVYYYDDDLLEWVWETPNATDEDMCIRCTVELGEAGIEAPIISIMLDGIYPTVTWEEVPGALSYTVYGSNDPEAAVPWTLIETNIQDLGYAYEGPDPFKFFYVIASTEIASREMLISPQKISTKPEITHMKKSEPRSLRKLRFASDKVD
ncbi:MAG: hypothetical protein LHW51_01930 [Candidatus Cloacimonetes bacterium]|nr:hypothetical protein [Candidatus Cloacimonadota bacterium]MCK9242730.1 hypothetical protein [Candidatus Cloacimonadota bacterium]